METFKVQNLGDNSLKLKIVKSVKVEADDDSDKKCQTALDEINTFTSFAENFETKKILSENVRVETKDESVQITHKEETVDLDLESFAKLAKNLETRKNRFKKDKKVSSLVDEKVCCKTCGKEFACKKYLHYHMRFVHGGELFKCDKCNWTTKRKVFLNYHISAKHSDTNLYKCNLCDYGTSRKNNLQSHIQSIHENLQFKCDKCDYTVKSKTVLDDHMKSVHEGSYKYACDQCSYKCMKPGRILEHRNAVHEKVTFQCNLCSMKTTSKSSLKAHIRGQHEGIKHYCDQCEYHSKSIAGLNKHKKLKHMNKEMEE